MIRKLLVLSVIALAACENPAEPVATEAPEIPPPPPSRKVVSKSNVIDLGMPAGALTAHAFDVNDDGDIAGYSVSATGVTRAYTWRGSFRLLSPLSGYTNSYAFGLNERNQVIGASQDANGRNRATIWSKDSPTDLGTLVSGGQSLGMAINGNGSAVGSATVADGSMRGFYYSFITRRMESMGLLPGGTYTVGQDLNSWGLAVGYGDTPDGDRAYLYNVWTGSLENLGTIPGGISSYGLSVNNSGQVVGYAFTAGGEPRAFHWQNGKITDLGVRRDAERGVRNQRPGRGGGLQPGRERRVPRFRVDEAERHGRSGYASGWRYQLRPAHQPARPHRRYRTRCGRHGARGSVECGAAVGGARD